MSAPRRVDARAGADDDDLRPVVDHLRSGGLVAYPTETVYGFGCALHEGALERLSALKGRETGKPFLVLVPEAGAVAGLAWNDDARELAEVFWPGAVTLVLADPLGTFPAPVRSRAGTVAVRRSSHPLARRLVELLGAPLTSTSANGPGAPPARSGDEAMAAALELGAGAELWVLDGGPLPGRASSTIVDCSTGRAAVVREGTTPVRRLRCVLPTLTAHKEPT